MKVFLKKELLEIAKGLASKFCEGKESQIENDILEELVKFHKEMEEYENKKEEVTTCFTIRQIAASVYAFSEKYNIYNTIMILYGANYKKNEREYLKKILNKSMCKHLTKYFKEDLNLPKGFLNSNIFINKSLIETIKSIEFSFNNFLEMFY